MLTLLDSSNSDCISSFHVNVVPGFKSARNGSILSAAANAYATWLTSPNHDRMSVMFACVGKSRIDSRNFLDGRTCCSDRVGPHDCIVNIFRFVRDV